MEILIVKIVEAHEFGQLRKTYEALGGTHVILRGEKGVKVALVPGVTLHAFKHDFAINFPGKRYADRGPYSFTVIHEDTDKHIRFYQEGQRPYVYRYYDGQPYVDEFYDLGALTMLPNQ